MGARVVKARRLWRYPFVVPHRILEKMGLEPIEARLARQAARAAEEFAAVIPDEASETGRHLEDVLRLQTMALRAWAHTVAALRESEEVIGDLRLPRWDALVRPRPNPGDIEPIE